MPQAELGQKLCANERHQRCAAQAVCHEGILLHGGLHRHRSRLVRVGTWDSQRGHGQRPAARDNPRHEAGKD
eukprot:14251120-Heterocapsa_arctica.AAC.1